MEAAFLFSPCPDVPRHQTAAADIGADPAQA